MAVPMQQKSFDVSNTKPPSKQDKIEFYQSRLTQWDGSKGSMIPRSTQDDTPEQRDVEFRRLWNLGGFAFWTSNYMDLFGVKESNDIIYQWWRDQVCKTVQDTSKSSILAPKDPPYAFGTKRVPLEQNYYEVFNLDHVDLVDLTADQIQQVESHGLVMKSGADHDFDIIILATGFDISTGSFDNIDIRGREGVKLKEKWSTKTSNYLGVSVNMFPNLLFPYGPLSPSNTCNGPVCAEIQGNWIVQLIEHLKKRDQTTVEADKAPEDEYTELVSGMLKGSLFESTSSFYFADKIPQHTSKGKQPMFWMGGVPAYIEKLATVADAGYNGFKIE
jgi:hypothetical protein